MRECGVDVNTKGPSGITALHLAISVLKDIDLVTFLISAGADVNAVCGDEDAPQGGGTPLYYAVKVRM